MRGRLIVMSWDLRERSGILDEDFLLWAKQKVADCDIDGAFDALRMEMLLADFSSGKLADYIAKRNDTQKGLGSSYAEIGTRLLEIGGAGIAEMDSRLIMKITDIRFQIDVMNHVGASINEYMKMTFDSSIHEGNRGIIAAEIDNKSALIARRAVLVVDKIDNVLALS